MPKKREFKFLGGTRDLRREYDNMVANGYSKEDLSRVGYMALLNAIRMEIWKKPGNRRPDTSRWEKDK